LGFPGHSQKFPRRVLIDLAEMCVGRFESRPPDSGMRTDVATLHDLIAAAGRGEAPDGLRHLVFPRATDRRPIGRRRDVITVMPNVTLAGIGTPYSLGGYTPMSIDGHW